MNRQRDFFEACIACLEQPDALDGHMHQAAVFLRALGYLPAPGSALEQSDPLIFENRQALLKLASRFEDTFHLPMPHAPGAAFFGGMVSPAAFGITGHGLDAAGVGGRGGTLRTAFESCIGEAAEYLSFLEWDDDVKIVEAGQEHGLTPDALGWAIAGAGLDGNDTAPVTDWVEAKSLLDCRPVHFPSELILRRPPSRRIGDRMAESNGVGAGVTFDQAMRTGLMEVIERDAVALWWFGGRPAKSFSHHIDGSPGFREFIRVVRGESERDTWFLDLTTDLDVPAVAALSSEINGQAVVAGFAADPDPDHAAQRAFLELCQMELAQKISIYKWRNMGDGALKEQDKVWIERFKTLNTENFPRLLMAEGSNETVVLPPDAALSKIVEHMAGAGFTPYASDLTRLELGIPVARIIVPGLQSAKPDWTSIRLVDTALTNGFDMTMLAHAPSPI